MAFERTWAQTLNNAQTPATALEETQRELWSLKAMLLGQYGGLTLGLWTIDSSCNSVTAGTQGDGVDRWHSGTFTAADIVRGIAGAAHSWFVLKSPLMNGLNFYLLISYDGGGTTSASLLMAKAPFAGGTTTANPTSADSWSVSGSPTIWNNGSTNSHRFNLLLSSTGDFWWFVVRAGVGWAELLVSVIAPTGCDSADLYPMWSFFEFSGGTGGVPDASALTQIVIATRDHAGVAASMDVAAAIRVPQGSTSVDSLTGKQLDQPMWLVVFVGSSSWHHRGRLPDCAMTWLSLSGLVPSNGDSVNPGGGIIAVSLASVLIPLTAVPNLT